MLIVVTIIFAIIINSNIVHIIDIIILILVIISCSLQYYSSYR